MAEKQRIYRAKLTKTDEIKQTDQPPVNAAESGRNY
jgi:hypothetical protein